MSSATYARHGGAQPSALPEFCGNEEVVHDSPCKKGADLALLDQLALIALAQLLRSFDSVRLPELVCASLHGTISYGRMRCWQSAAINSNRRKIKSKDSAIRFAR